MKRWDPYEAFVHVVDSGSFTAAAKRLQVSKSVVSRLISQLEDRLGAQLLFRTTRSLAPTDLGSAVYRQCLNIFDGLEEIENEAMDFDGVPRGRLRMVASDHFGEHYIAPLAAELLERYPSLEIEVQITSRMIDIVAEGFDLAILYSNLSSSTLLAQKIFELPHVVAASPEYLARHGTPASLDDLKDHNCLAATFEACTPWRFNHNGGEQAMEVKGTWRSNSGPAMIEAAMRGIGIVRLPELYMRAHIASGRLMPLLENYSSAAMPVWAVYPGGRHTASKVRMFVDYLKTRLRELDSKEAVLDAQVH